MKYIFMIFCLISLGMISYGCYLLIESTNMFQLAKAAAIFLIYEKTFVASQNALANEVLEEKTKKVKIG